MDIINHTPFPALAMEGGDQYDHEFHVLVLRQTLSFGHGELGYADKQVPLCETDEFFGNPASSSVRQESDLCQYKPKCDIIVNATAHAIPGKATRRLEVRLLVLQPDGFVASEPEQARAKPSSAKRLIDKRLWVYGEREFKRKLWLVRLAQWSVKWATLTMLRPPAWKLTRAKPFTALPLRYEFAYGGQCRVNGGDKAARKVRRKNLLTPQQRANSVDRAAIPAQQAIAHTVFDPNPFGRGFAQAWAVKARSDKAIPAPRIERIGGLVTARQFSRWLTASDTAAKTVREHVPLQNVAGYGVRSKCHPGRSRLLGTVDANFVQSQAPLPKDFDPAYWNAAPPDQQLEFLRGGETFELANLCAPDTPGATADANGNTILRLTLPRHECFVRLEVEHAEALDAPMHIDTVIVEPDERRLTLVWRLTVAKLTQFPVRLCELRMRPRVEGAR